MTTLKQLLPSQDIDALLGDIAEERSRRSRLWYWTQIVAIVVVGSWRVARAHPLLALRAIATGTVALTAYFWMVSVAGRVVVVLSNGGYYVAGHWLTLPHPPGPPPPYDTLVALGIDAVGFVIAGWAIVHLHRAYGVAMTLPFVFLTMLMGVVVLVILTTDTGPGTRTMPLHEFVATFGTLFLSIPGGILAGGVFALRKRRQRPRQD